ncbi:MAG: hypothetical protein K1X67_14700 [Fimbriimonadaceae bacterium]|nr:hypothetical protein [Fimbriimonadaceae bacterium]
MKLSTAQRVFAGIALVSFVLCMATVFVGGDLWGRHRSTLQGRIIAYSVVSMTLSLLAGAVWQLFRKADDAPRP